MQIAREERERARILWLVKESEWQSAKHIAARYQELYHEEMSVQKVKNILQLFIDEGLIRAKSTRQRNFARNVYSRNEPTLISEEKL
ncbi:hypothetical protein IX51_04785 [uncultured archaeon]|nr:hypothetical protein IX51_04785 [uncultured archaeon]